MRLNRLLPAAALALAGCDYSVPDAVTSGVIVYTQPANGAVFTPFSTYCLDDRVRVRKDGQDQPDIAPVPALIRQQVKTDMTAAGYTETLPAASQNCPDGGSGIDLGLKLSLSTGTTTYWYSGGWCDIYYGYYGCWYQPVYGGSYSFGTTLLTMVDTRTASTPGQPFPGLWAAVMYGILYDYPTYDQPRLAGGIAQAFAQSPYLHK